MKSSYKIPGFLLVLICTMNLSAQNEFSKWYFGSYAGLDFSTQPPTALSNSSMSTVEGVATVSDASGNLLFYTDGVQVYNSTHAYMANGLSLFGGGSTTQSAIIVKQPGSNTIYYIFTADDLAGPNGYRYSIVDMTLAAGLGSVTVKNAALYSPTCEKQVAVRHCNGRDVWLVSHHYGSNEFRTYLLTSAGLGVNPIVSAIGETPGMTVTPTTLGQLKISPDGKKLAMASFTISVPNSLGVGGFHLFDFDAATGVVSNSLTLLGGTNLTMNAGAYGIEFSPDGTKLYGSTSPGLSPNYTCTLFQWSICNSNTTAIVASQYSFNLTGLGAGSLQRATDGKIYLAVGGGTTTSLGIINNPNASGAALNFVPNGLDISPGVSSLGLPNFINPYQRVPYALFSHTVSCQNVSFMASPALTFSSGCSASPYLASGYLWDFGDPISGSANTSTLANPVHNYSLTGTYSVSLILYSNCTNDTLRKVVTITTPGPTLAISGNTLICKNTKATFTASGGSTFQWSNNTTASTATFSPANTAVYSVSATLNGCTESKQFTITISPCTAIPTNADLALFQVYPNPVKDLLSVEATAAGNILVFNMNGLLVLDHKITRGHNEINVSDLKHGVYNMLCSDGKGVWRSRLVKMD